MSLPPSHPFGSEGAKDAIEPARITAPRPLWQRVSVVEMPVDAIPGAPPRRAHHALRIATDAPKAFLRGLGFEPSDCAAQLRAPARMKQERGDTNVDVQAQVRIGCRF
ncbi:hypothetical protein [Caldimonas sp. KR1-144]|uniref:hypothetical protein n=1 Tax=Caldimonas sp. KR1-144 TaxID=3400911 RepID=UPI003C00FDDA